MNQRINHRGRKGPSSGNKDKPKKRGGRRRRSGRGRGNGGEAKAEAKEPARDYSVPTEKHIPKRYGVVFYATLDAAKEDGDTLLDKAKEVDQLNIVIRAEAPMNDPQLLQYGKLFAGEAWALIHERRVEEGWYNEPH